ncbi:hypothetical protein Pmar_PMAR024677 [Perkinsus marinus ATCC 50983]|uniref:Uncharacterized protein n=1 Tax=Perkinsus marinus (strain ATCC 50983 / TXsc) TaxID=423536 RepID=C5M1B6_PERM5|nr:hypothetical protein Pmar_PMAR024677 [Perkinsus marinus ATCC 50983]EEQ97238.1 hypothetical protein Pmar_PMAR024677 [Perkinsus marinus ATCC 50983]|eukprot:XP_002764521.1 hypothetical protein Pmar_PMAR024677 [Perkinsus marinus ATCC 50983]
MTGGISDPEPPRVVKGDDMSLDSDSSPTAESSNNSSQLGPVEIIRAEFTKGNRPVIGSPIWPYVLVRESRLRGDEKNVLSGIILSHQFDKKKS